MSSRRSRRSSSHNSDHTKEILVYNAAADGATQELPESDVGNYQLMMARFLACVKGSTRFNIWHFADTGRKVYKSEFAICLKLKQMQVDCLLLESGLISSRSMTIRGGRKTFESLVGRYEYLKHYVRLEKDRALDYIFSDGSNFYSNETSRFEAIAGWKTLYKKMINECETKQHKDKIIKCRAIQRTQRQRNSDADNEEDAEDEDEHSSGRAQPQDNAGDEATGGGTIDDQGESNSSSLTTNTTTTEEGRGDVPDTAAPRTISWKSNQNDEDEVQESYNTSLLRRAKKEAPKHLLALHDMVNGDKDLALAILALAKREIEGEKRISKQGLIDVDKAIVLAIKNTIEECKPKNGSGSYRKENQEMIYGILAAISNGLPSVTGKDGICKALAKITDCVIRKRLSVSYWMAASSQKMMSHLETIREYKHPVREVRKDSRRAGLAEEAV